MMIRDAAEDTVLRNIGPNRDQLLPIPRGTRLVVDMIGILTHQCSPLLLYNAHPKQILQITTRVISPTRNPTSQNAGTMHVRTTSRCFLLARAHVSLARLRA